MVIRLSEDSNQGIDSSVKEAGVAYCVEATRHQRLNVCQRSAKLDPAGEALKTLVVYWLDLTGGQEVLHQRQHCQNTHT